MNNTIWTLPTDLLEQSLRVMRPHGARGREGLALWFGQEQDDRVRVTHVVEPYGRGFATSPYHMELSMRGMAALTDLAEKIEAPLVGQIHSHPGTFLDLSELDERAGIRLPGYLSLVCPHYAQIRSLSLGDCGVHVFERDAYRRLDREEIQRRIAIGTSPSIFLRCEVLK